MDHRSHPPAMSEYGYSSDKKTMASNDLPPWESGFHFGNIADTGDYIERLERKVRKSVDPRLLALLEIFQQLYVERKELFKKIFPGHHEEFGELFKKIGEMAPPQHVKTDRRVKVQTMQRSLSVGSPRKLSKGGGESPVRLERFKVRTLNVGGVQEGGQGGAQSSGSK